MSKKLPKHIIQLVEKNNLVIAIKTLATEQGISMSEAKVLIDEYELKLKQNQAKKLATIASKQSTTPTNLPKSTPSTEPISRLNHTTDYQSTAINNKSHCSKTSLSNQAPLNSINDGLDQHLASVGYKKTLLPYWIKRLIIILSIMLVLGIIFWRVLV